MLALHERVPDAIPPSPEEELHRTLATPVSSAALPLMLIELPVVETIVRTGDWICTVGGVVSLPADGVTGGVAGGVTGGLGGGVTGGVAGGVTGGVTGGGITGGVTLRVVSLLP